MILITNNSEGKQSIGHKPHCCRVITSLQVL
uniref:Uncharacterized protein n=1 Tax=Arundo donax TaxID=35708 RepID=A0A0A8YNP7_ARUDO